MSEMGRDLNALMQDLAQEASGILAGVVQELAEGRAVVLSHNRSRLKERPVMDDEGRIWCTYDETFSINYSGGCIDINRSCRREMKKVEE